VPTGEAVKQEAVKQRAVVLCLTAALLLCGLVGQTSSQVASAAATTAGQVVTVSSPTAGSTYATVEAWARQADGRYKRVAHFTSARVGSAGVGATSEGLSRTPAGRYPLNQAFGIKPNPGASMPYFQVDRNDVWTGSNGSVINQHKRCAPGTCPASYGAFERLSNYPGPYNYGVFIGYNAPAPYGTGAVAGKGSAFFLHVKNSAATAGCVAVSETQMVWLLRWLRTDQKPIIAIGVGANAYNPIPNRYI
jgi:L,D-peptidoglycan transpeptidase YkuD (ErfK/YbiS/YcfS/YnhG family)